MMSDTTDTDHIPSGLTAVMPYLLVPDVGAAIGLYAGLFDVEEVLRHEEGGTVVHAKVRIGGSLIELGRHEIPGAEKVTDLTSVGVHVYVPDVDAAAERAITVGCRILSPAMDQPYGDREVSIVDPFGVVWFVATHLGD